MEKHSSARRGGEKRRRDRRRGSPVLVVVWIVLVAVLALAVALLYTLLPGRGRSTAPEATQPPLVWRPGSAFVTDTTAPPLVTGDGTGGRRVDIGTIRADLKAPESVTFGLLRGVDLGDIRDRLRENAAAAGWGEVECAAQPSGGEMRIYAVEQAVLSGQDFERQEAFLKTAQPENLARTFLQNSGLVPMLREHGLNLGLEAENHDGMIIFHGTGDAGRECTVSFSFLYTGAFNQAWIRAEYLDDAVISDKVVPLKRAAENAVTWSSASTGRTDVSMAELRQIRGLPFYVFTCDDGTVCYALAVEARELSRCPGAEAVYSEMMHSGIQEYVETPGAGF